VGLRDVVAKREVRHAMQSEFNQADARLVNGVPLRVSHIFLERRKRLQPGRLEVALEAFYSSGSHAPKHVSMEVRSR